MVQTVAQMNQLALFGVVSPLRMPRMYGANATSVSKPASHPAATWIVRAHPYLKQYAGFCFKQGETRVPLEAGAHKIKACVVCKTELALICEDAMF